MPNLTLSLPEKTYSEMKRFPKVKWSVVAREAIARELEELKLLDKLMDKGAISLESIKAEALPVLKKNNIARAAIFGSTARGEAKATSDVDFLVEFKKRRPTLLDIGGLKNDLEEKLKRSADIILFGSIDPRLKERILRDKVDIL